jgi:hypothetical protein
MLQQVGHKVAIRLEVLITQNFPAFLVNLCC